MLQCPFRPHLQLLLQVPGLGAQLVDLPALHDQLVVHFVHIIPQADGALAVGLLPDHSETADDVGLAHLGFQAVAGY